MLAHLLPKELVSHLELEEDYRGEQIFRWIQSGTDCFTDMTDLPKALRERFGKAHGGFSSAVEHRVEAEDGSVKYRITLSDNSRIEAVLLSDRQERATACLSTQVGCGMGCSFCRTGTMGFHRNLEPYEIVEQLILIRRETAKVSNVVFMGMGEPLHNLEGLHKAIAVFTHPSDLAFSPRRITVSTVGIESGIRDLAENCPPVRLAVSIITADPQLRQSLVPAARSNSLEDLKKALLHYQDRTGHRITLEIVLLKGVNDRRADVEALAELLPPLKANVNLIPWNPVPGFPFRSPGTADIKRFQSHLEEKGLKVTQRYRRGRGINAACGQLCVAQDSSDSSYPR